MIPVTPKAAATLRVIVALDGAVATPGSIAMLGATLAVGAVSMLEVAVFVLTLRPDRSTGNAELALVKVLAD